MQALLRWWLQCGAKLGVSAVGCSPILQQMDSRQTCQCLQKTMDLRKVAQALTGYAGVSKHLWLKGGGIFHGRKPPNVFDEGRDDPADDHR